MRPLKLHLGAGKTTMGDGWINCDFLPSSTVDKLFDVTKEWPFPDNSVGEIYASHMLEHLHDFRGFFKESWRVMLPVSSMLLRLPYGGHKLAWADPTHTRPWFPESFCWLQPGYGEDLGSLQHYNWSWPFAIEMVQLRLNGKLVGWVDKKWKRRLLCRFLEFLDNVVDELWGHLRPVKTQEDFKSFRSTRASNVVPFQYVMYKHQMEGHELEKGEVADFVHLMDGFRLNDLE